MNVGRAQVFKLWHTSWIPKRIQLPPRLGKETTIPNCWITRVYARTIEYKYGSKLRLGWDPHEPWKRDGRVISSYRMWQTSLKDESIKAVQVFVQTESCLRSVSS